MEDLCTNLSAISCALLFKALSLLILEEIDYEYCSSSKTHKCFECCWGIKSLALHGVGMYSRCLLLFIYFWRAYILIVGLTSQCISVISLYSCSVEGRISGRKTTVYIPAL